MIHKYRLGRLFDFVHIVRIKSLFFITTLINMSTSNWQTWFRNGKEHLSQAKKALSSGLDGIAYEKAVIAGECTLKSVLVKNGKFARRDWTHDQEQILTKIKNENLLSSSILAQIEDIITDQDGVDGLSWVDLDYGGSHQDCPHIAQTRYPTDNYTSYDMLSAGNAQEKIQLAEKLILILDGNF